MENNIEFGPCKHLNNKFNLFCDECGKFYLNIHTYWYFAIPFLFVALYYFGLSTLYVFSTLSLLSLFYVFSTQREILNVKDKDNLNIGVKLITPIAFSFIVYLSSINNIIFMSFLPFLFIIFLLSINKGLKDIKSVSNTISKLSLYIVAFNFILSFLHLSIFLSSLFIPWVNELLIYFNNITLIRIISLFAIFSLLSGYAIFAALKHSIKTPNINFKFDTNNVPQPFNTMLIVMSNIISSILNIFYIIRERMMLCYKEFIKIISSSVKMFWILFFNIIKIIIIFGISILLFFSIYKFSQFIILLWSSKMLLSLSVYDWLNGLLFFIMSTISTMLLILSSYKKFEVITKDNMYSSIFGTFKEVVEMIKITYHQISLYIFYISLSLFISWSLINVVNMIIIGTIFPPTIGILYLSFILIFILMIIFYPRNKN